MRSSGMAMVGGATSSLHHRHHHHHHATTLALHSRHSFPSPCAQTSPLLLRSASIRSLSISTFGYGGHSSISPDRRAGRAVLPILAVGSPSTSSDMPNKPPFIGSVFDFTLAPPPALSDVVWSASGAFVAMAIMGALDKLVNPLGISFTIAPFGAVTALLFAAPHTPAARKYNIFVAHIGCATAGVIALALFGPGWIARSVALAASVAFMQCTGSFHPPAAGLPILFIDAPKFHRLQWWYALFPGAAGCILLCLLQEAVTFMKKKFKF